MDAVDAVDAARYKCREVGGRKSKWAMGEGCWSHRADRGLDLAQAGGCVVDRGQGDKGTGNPWQVLATKMRVQDLCVRRA